MLLRKLSAQPNLRPDAELYWTTVMRILDLAKATIVCGALGYLTYTFPLLGQIMVISILSLLWLFYAQQTVQSLRRR